jgi:hypothetical protein
MFGIPHEHPRERLEGFPRQSPGSPSEAAATRRKGVVTNSLRDHDLDNSRRQAMLFRCRTNQQRGPGVKHSSGMTGTRAGAGVPNELAGGTERSLIPTGVQPSVWLSESGAAWISKMSTTSEKLDYHSVTYSPTSNNPVVESAGNNKKNIQQELAQGLAI